jgi:hypothetical protein
VSLDAGTPPLHIPALQLPAEALFQVFCAPNAEKENSATRTGSAHACGKGTTGFNLDAILVLIEDTPGTWVPENLAFSLGNLLEMQNKKNTRPSHYTDKKSPCL